MITIFLKLINDINNSLSLNKGNLGSAVDWISDLNQQRILRFDSLAFYLVLVSIKKIYQTLKTRLSRYCNRVIWLPMIYAQLWLLWARLSKDVSCYRSFYILSVLNWMAQIPFLSFLTLLWVTIIYEVVAYVLYSNYITALWSCSTPSP